MISDFIFVGAAIACTVAGTYTDMKERMVPDWINYFMLFFGIGGHAMTAVAQWYIMPLLYSLGAVGIIYAISYVLYYTGAWGGGDAKLAVGLGALLPTLPALTTSMPLAVAPWPWLFTLWINTLLFGTAFGILGSVYLAAKHRAKFIPEFRLQLKKNRAFVYLSPAFLALPVAVYLLKLPASILIFSFLAIIVPVLYITLKSVENSCMFKLIAPHKLVEGDWVAESVTAGGYTYKPARAGIGKKDLDKLMALEREGKISRIRVKEGMPYVPALLAGLLLSVFYGDVIYSFINALV